MSYLVLARKYRPQNFDEVYAQEHVTTILKNAISMNRIAHAFLFTGSRGVGKTSMARIFAKSLNCMEGLNPIPCNKCENCVEITQGSATDVVEIDGASNTGVEDIRDLQKELMYATSKSRFKIFIIDEVHMLSKNAFNALLKTLEEPPDRVIFIFATTEPHKVLPTIISRCQRYDFKRIPIESIVSRLKFICKAEEIVIDDEALYLVAKKADGSMRDAQSLMDQLIAVGKTEIKTNDVLTLFGIVPTDVYHKISEYLKEKKTAAIIALLHNILEKGNDLQEFLNGFLDYIRILLLLKADVPQPELPPVVKKEMEQINSLYSDDTLLYILSILIKAKTDIRYANNPLLIMEMTLLKLTKLEEMISISDILNKIPQKQYSEPASPPPSYRKTSQEVKNDINQQMVREIDTELPKYSELTPDIFQQTKEHFIKRLKRELPFAAGYIRDAKVLSIENGKILFEVDKETAYKYLKSNQSKLNKIFSDFYRLKLSFDVSLALEEKEEPDYIKNPSLKDIQRELPDLAKFIEETEASITQITDKKPLKQNQKEELD